MIVCPHCGRENEDHYKFCLGCGSQLPRQEVAAEPEQPKMIHCPHCGSQVPSNFKFCGACGGPIAGFLSGSLSEVSSAGGLSTSDPPVLSGSSLVGDAPSAIPTLSAAVEPPPSASRTPGLPLNSDAPMLAEATSQIATHMVEESSPAIGNALAKLVVIRPDGTEGATIPMYEGGVVIGRSSEHDVLSGDPFLSPEHAVIEMNGAGFLLKDLNSLNGVFYRIRNEVELSDGDSIRLGQELLSFHLMDSPDIVLADERDASDADTLRGGSPDIGYWGKLSVVSGPDIESRAYVFSDDEINIGRERGDILFRDDGFVSGLHARVIKVDNRVILKDLGSSNGTYIRVRGERELVDGDLILMGQQLFRLVA